MNGNGINDLIWHNDQTGFALIWYLAADGFFMSSQLIRDTPSSTAWRVVGVTDVTGNGRPEIVWHNRSSGHTYIWYLNADGTYNEGQFVRERESILSWQIVEIKDITGNGRAEILWHNNSSGQACVWYLNADGTYNEGRYVREIGSVLSWRIVGLADVTGNNRPEIIWHNQRSGFVYIWHLNADGTYQSGSFARENPSALSWHIVGLADVNNNGRSEIVWHNRSTGRTVLWFLDTDGTYQSGMFARYRASATSWHIQSVRAR
jgi:hypothetical protein